MQNYIKSLCQRGAGVHYLSEHIQSFMQTKLWYTLTVFRSNAEILSTIVDDVILKISTFLFKCLWTTQNRIHLNGNRKTLLILSCYIQTYVGIAETTGKRRPNGSLWFHSLSYFVVGIAETERYLSRIAAISWIWNTGAKHVHHHWEPPPSKCRQNSFSLTDVSAKNGATRVFHGNY